MSDLSEIELKERFGEGLKKAASRCRELSAATKDKSWTALAVQLDKLRHNGEKMIHQRSLTRNRTLEELHMIGQSMATEKKNGE